MQSLVSPQAACCKNHPEVAGRFFQVEQPEVRYCKSCALNMALCGRRIEQELTPEQYERKLLVDSTAQRLRANATDLDANDAYYDQLATILDLSAHGIARRLEALDGFIRHLAQLKLKLEAEFENQLQLKAKEFLARREELAAHRATIRQQLEHIESNFGSIVEEEDTPHFSDLKAGWADTIARTSRDLLSQPEFSFEKNIISESVAGFEREFREIAKLRVFETAPLTNCDGKENVDDDGFNCHRLVEELKLNLANAQAKPKPSRKNTERESRGQRKGKECLEEGRRFRH